MLHECASMVLSYLEIRVPHISFTQLYYYTLFTGKQCCITSLLYKLFEVDITINGYCWAIKNKLKAFETDSYFGSKFPSLHSPLPKEGNCAFTHEFTHGLSKPLKPLFQLQL